MGTRVRRYDISLSCVNCGGFFTASRSDAKFCGDKCRKEAERKVKRMDEQFESMLGALEGHCNQYGRARRDDLVSQLVKLQKIVNAKIDRYDY